MRWTLLALVLASLSACVEQAAPTVPASFDVEASNAQPRARGLRSGQRAGGRQTRYALSVDRRTRTASLSTLECETDAGCGEPCDASYDFCAAAEAVYEPLDGGQVAIGDAFGSADVVECPPYINGGIWFSWRGHGFVVWGTHTREAALRSWPWGEAEYSLPAGPHESQDGRAVIWSGIVKGKCVGYYDRRHGEFNGLITFSWLRGDAREAAGPTGSDTSAGGSQTYTVSNGTLTTTSSGGVHTGDPVVDEVVNRWLETGECTDGWAILVDGARVC